MSSDILCFKYILYPPKKRKKKEERNLTLVKMGNVMLQTACYMSVVLVVAVSWCGQESIMVVAHASLL